MNNPDVNAIYAAVIAGNGGTDDGRISCPLPGHGKGQGDRNPSARVFITTSLKGEEYVSVSCFSATCQDKWQDLYDAVVRPYRPSSGGGSAVPWAIDETYDLKDGKTGDQLRYDHPGGDCPKPVKLNGVWTNCPDTEPHKHVATGRDGKPMKGINLNGAYVRVRGETNPVIVCEGAKAARAVRAQGYSTVTSLNGAGSAHKSDWSPMAGREAILWPDIDRDPKKDFADQDGELYIGEAARRIIAAGGTIAGVVRLDIAEDAGKGYDAADLLADKGRSAIGNAILAAVPYEIPEAPAPKRRGRPANPMTVRQPGNARRRLDYGRRQVQQAPRRQHRKRHPRPH